MSWIYKTIGTIIPQELDGNTSLPQVGSNFSQCKTAIFSVQQTTAVAQLVHLKKFEVPDVIHLVAAWELMATVLPGMPLPSNCPLSCSLADQVSKSASARTFA